MIDQLKIYACDENLRVSLQERLLAHDVSTFSATSLRRAAVTLLIVEDSQGEASIILTRRPKTLRQHSGQYALPGGKLEDSENAIQAALRETHEEVGVELDESSVLGVMDDYQTRSGFCITPVVVWSGPNTLLKPDPNEVALVFHIPFWDLASPDIPQLQDSVDSSHPVLSAPLQTVGHEVYAPTAAIMYQLREIAIFGRSTRVAHFDQPNFARK